MLNRQHIPGIALAVVASIVSVVLVATFDGNVLGNDFAQMTSVAGNIIAGNGIQTDLIYYDVHYAMHAPRVPQTVFPPGQALLVSPLMVLGVPSHTAALVWSLLAFLVSGLFLAATLRRLGLDDWVVGVTLITWLILGINWANVLACRSESLLIAMTVLGLYGFVRWSDGAGEARAPLILLGTAAACGFLFRYQGLFFIAAIGLYFFVRALRERELRAFLDLVVVSAIPGNRCRRYVGLQCIRHRRDRWRSCGPCPA